MLLEENKIAGTELTLAEADEILQELGFVRWAWDYDHATYDYKYEHLQDTYYLRIHGRVIKGQLEEPHAVLRLETPFMGKAVFPHGIDYDVTIPNSILDLAKRKLQAVEEKLHAE
ncbi:hypothetical protein BSNK01_05980 [Bacillaceae bacterium]